MLTHLSRFFKLLVYVGLVGALLAAVSLNLAQRDPVYQPLAETQISTEINHADWNSDRLIAVATPDGVGIYDQDFNHLTQFNQGMYIRAVAWSADNTQIAVTNLNTVEIWDWDSVTETATINTTLNVEVDYGPVMRLKWSPHGDRLAAIVYFEVEAGYSGRIYIWDTSTWALTIMPGHYFLDLLTVTPDIINWDPINPDYLLGTGFAGQVEDGVRTVETERIAYTLDTTTGSRIQEIPIGQPKGLGIAKQPSGDFIAVGAETSLKIYYSSTGDYFFPTMTTFYSAAVDWSPDGKRLIADNFLIDVENDMGMGQYALYSTVVAALWREDGGAILLAQKDGHMTIEDPNILRGYDHTITPTGESTEEVNYAPIADAGPDQFLEARQQDQWLVGVVLDASGSFDPDGTIVNYSWRKASNGVEFATGVSPQLQLSFGQHDIHLEVEDDGGEIASDWVNIIIAQAPTPTKTPSPTRTRTLTPTPFATAP